MARSSDLSIPTRRAAALVVGASLAWILSAADARATPLYRSVVPHGYTHGSGAYGTGCLACHDDPDGAHGCAPETWPCLNPFGLDFRSSSAPAHRAFTWDAWLRDRDSDGDQRTNGQESVYFGATYSGSGEGPAMYATMPGASASFATDECWLQSSPWGYSDHPWNLTNCSASAICTDTDSTTAAPSGRYFGFTCSCPPGYQGNGRIDVPGDDVDDPEASACADLDECVVPSTCGQSDPVNACTNYVGGHDCTCGPGFVEVGSGTASETCEDVDECSDPTRCDAHLGRGACTDIVGAYACECAPGFAFDGITCVPPNECTTGAHDCDPNARCTDTPSGYACACRAGYTGDGRTGGTGCTDLDECADPSACGRDLASTNACTNTIGGHFCACGPGHRIDGTGPSTTCVDLDECAVSPGICGVGECTDAIGSYACSCPAGYVARDGGCADVDECADPSRCAHDVSATNVCMNAAGRYGCSCGRGFAPSGAGASATCADVDECAAGLCDPHATCVNEIGSHACTCNAGFEGSGRVCRDVDECASGTAACGANELCANRFGAPYECVCAPGFRRDASTGVCTAPPVDAGALDAASVDAALAQGDAAVPDGSTPDGGIAAPSARCACRITSARSDAGASWLVAIVATAVVVRRRRANP